METGEGEPGGASRRHGQHMIQLPLIPPSNTYFLSIYDLNVADKVFVPMERSVGYGIGCDIRAIGPKVGMAVEFGISA